MSQYLELQLILVDHCLHHESLVFFFNLKICGAMQSMMKPPNKFIPLKKKKENVFPFLLQKKVKTGREARISVLDEIFLSMETLTITFETICPTL